jgi:O-antigen ligase
MMETMTILPIEEPVAPYVPTAVERAALRVVQFGALAVVLIATTHRAFDLDRFFVPKELVLHVTAAISGLLLIRRIRINWTLLSFLGISILSALFATNGWVAGRAVAITASGIVLFGVGRALREAGLGREVAGTMALAVVVAAVTSLLQAYGIHLDIFAINRAPGGTLGNRNFVAHAAAFGLPVVLLAAMRGRRRATIGVVLVTAALVLTRSRAAWLAFAAVVIIFLLAMVMLRMWRRLALIVICAGAGVAAALLLPNALQWRSDNPYLESVRGVANYQEGSGHGRLLQYRRSLFMSPIIGVGPGNWAVEYPGRVPSGDPSLDQSVGGMTSNPWPSSDWVAFSAERGFAGVVLMAMFFLALLRNGWRQLREAHDVDERLVAATLIAMVIGACVAGAFDAVLLLALPTLLIFTTLGVLSATPVEAHPRHALLMLLVIAISIAGAARSGAQVIAMDLYTRGVALQRASELDPGNYRLHVRLARGRHRCAHARAAHALYPNADEARALARGCSK